LHSGYRSAPALIESFYAMFADFVVTRVDTIIISNLQRLVWSPRVELPSRIGVLLGPISVAIPTQIDIKPWSLKATPYAVLLHAKAIKFWPRNC
jgi:hypothetical protein